MYVDCSEKLFLFRPPTKHDSSCAKKVSEDSLVQCRLFLRSRLADQSGGNLFCAIAHVLSN